MRLFALAVVGINVAGSLVSVIADDEIAARMVHMVCAIVYGAACCCIWNL